VPTRFTNRIKTHRKDENPPIVRRVPASSVPYGESISQNGLTVWVAMDGERVVCVGATSAEVRRKYRELMKVGAGSNLERCP
jgi:riboflavin synthase alpha subunit